MRKRKKAFALGVFWGGLLLVLCQWGCPKCIDYPLYVTLSGAQEVDSVEWSLHGDFKPCVSSGGDYACGDSLQWGACGPPEEGFKGRYLIRVVKGEEETQGSTLVEDVSCTSTNRFEMDVSVLSMSPAM